MCGSVSRQVSASRCIRARNALSEYCGEINAQRHHPVYLINLLVRLEPSSRNS